MDIQIDNVYKLLDRKKSLTESLLNRWTKIDKSLLRSSGCDLKTYISRLSDSDEEIVIKINSLGKSWIGGLDKVDKDIILGFYLLSKGRILKTDYESMVRDLHVTILGLISICIHSKSLLPGELSDLKADLDDFSKSLKDADNLLASIDKRDFILGIENEERINKSLKEKINDKLQIKLQQEIKEPVNRSEAEQFIEHMLYKFGVSTRKMVSYGLIAVMLLSVNYTQLRATDPIEKPAAVISNFNPIFPTDIKYRVNALFGKRVIQKGKGTTNHRGIDIGCPMGSDVIAINDGIVTIGKNSGSGLYLIIDHGNIRSLYAHLSKVNFKNGDFVKTGQIIASSGNSGDLITGPCLHFAILDENPDVDKAQRFDPLPFFSSDIIRSLNVKTETISWAQAVAYHDYLNLLQKSGVAIGYANPHNSIDKSLTQ